MGGPERVTRVMLVGHVRNPEAPTAEELERGTDITDSFAPAEPVLFLCSDDLLSKWGFDDGSEPDELLDYLDAHGLDYPGRDVWTDVLRRLVRGYLVPALAQDVELVDIATSHNPIRVDMVDGVGVRDYWTREPEEFPVRLDRVTVAVPMARVLAMVREVDAQAADFGQTGGRDDPRPGGPDRHR